MRQRHDSLEKLMYDEVRNKKAEWQAVAIHKGLLKQRKFLWFSYVRVKDLEDLRRDILRGDA